MCAGNDKSTYKPVGKCDYDEYYNQVLVKEQPFYRAGMTKLEAASELRYLNEHLDDFYRGTYMPLWKQEMFR